VPTLRKASRHDVGHGGFRTAGGRGAGASSSVSAATVSGDLRLRSWATNVHGPATAEADPQRQLWRLDLGACLAGQVCVVSPHGAIAGATGPVRFGPINDGLRRIEPMLCPIYEALLARNRLGEFHQADETRWLVFVLLEGNKAYGWWLWVILGVDTVVYLLDSSRAARCWKASGSTGRDLCGS
jgi:hypothetical protein